MQQLTITIGRGGLGAANRIGEAAKWDRFVEDSKALVRRHGFEIVVANFGTGTWQGADGEPQSEPNFVIVGIRDLDGGWLRAEREPIRREVRNLRYVYGQEAIAVGFGESELIED